MAIEWFQEGPLKMDYSDGYHWVGALSGGGHCRVCAFRSESTRSVVFTWSAVATMEHDPIWCESGFATSEGALDTAKEACERWIAAIARAHVRHQT
jgi:hypothetical protein